MARSQPLNCCPENLCSAPVWPIRTASPRQVPFRFPTGMQEISVQLEAQRVVGGRIAAGDTVGIVVLFDKGAVKDSPDVETGQQVFHKVLVTSVQRSTGQGDHQSVH